MERKEAIEVIKKNWPDSSFTMLREALETLIPELKESEDDEIRKDLLYWLYSYKDGNETFVPAGDVDVWISYLEKQGEQQDHSKFLDSIQIGDQVTKNEDGVLVNLSQLKRVAKTAEKQGEQKPTEEIEPTPIFRIGDVLKRKGRDYTFRVDRIQGGYYHCDRNHGASFPIEEQDNWELVEQKPAWSEEDEAIYYGVVETEQYMLDVVYGRKEFDIGNESIKEECTRELNWLKSLKDRVQPQPKQEWTMQDEEELQIALDTLVKAGQHSSAKWLKNVCLVPQSQWKPSDEQIREGLDKAASEWDSKAWFSPIAMVMDGDRPVGTKQYTTSHADSFKAGVEWVINKIKAL